MASRLSVIFALAFVAIAYGQVTVGQVTVNFKADSCELENGFEFEECGKVNDAKVCCSPEEQCVSAKPWTGDEQFACSAARSLTGNKVVKIVLIPVFLSIVFLGFASYLIIEFKKDRNMRPVVGLCIKQVVLSGLLLFSPLWGLAFYTVVLNFLVACGVKSKGLAWWAYRLLFVLQFFHIIAIFGPFETFHVPFADLSTYKSLAASNNLEQFAGQLSASEAVCAGYYSNYFDLLDIEKIQEDVNPNQTTYGYCVKEWLTIVHFLCVVIGVIQCFLVFLTGRLLLNATTPTKKDDEFAINAPAQEIIAEMGETNI
jgi:hypothetical protein